MSATNDHGGVARMSGGGEDIRALDLRVRGLEGRMEVVEEKMEAANRELRANTVLTQQVHEATERIEAGVSGIVAATQWLSTTKRLVIFALAGVTGASGAIVAAAAALKALGVL